MRRPLIGIAVLLAVTGIVGGTTTTRLLWEKSPDSDTDRFCIAVQSECFGLMDSKGNIIARFDPPIRDRGDFHDGLMQAFDPTTGNSGYVNQDGAWAIAPRFKIVWAFEGGYAHVREEFGKPQRVIDTLGRFLSSPRRPSDYRHGLAPHKSEQDSLVGYVDIAGEWVISPRFASAGSFSEQDALARVKDPNQKWGYIDTSGAYAITPHFAYATDFQNGRATVAKETPCWYHGFDDNIGGPAFYVMDDRGSLEPFATQPFGYQECKFRILDSNGKIRSKQEYQWLTGFTPAGVSAKVADKWGILGLDGEWITPPVWDQVLPFSEGLAGVYKRGQGWGFVDRLGIVVIEPAFFKVREFSEGLAMVATSPNEAFYIQTDGSKAFNRMFRRGAPFRLGIAHVMLDEDTWEYIDTQGRTVFHYTRESAKSLQTP